MILGEFLDFVKTSFVLRSMKTGGGKKTFEPFHYQLLKNLESEMFSKCHNECMYFIFTFYGIKEMKLFISCLLCSKDFVSGLISSSENRGPLKESSA